MFAIKNKYKPTPEVSQFGGDSIDKLHIEQMSEFNNHNGENKNNNTDKYSIDDAHSL